MKKETKFIHSVDKNIGYFKFMEGAKANDFKDAFEDYVKMVTNPSVTRFVVVMKTKRWDSQIEQVWLKTAEMAEQNNIEKWGIVSPDSAIQKMTFKRIVKRNNFMENPKYDFKISISESEVMDWIKL